MPFEQVELDAPGADILPRDRREPEAVDGLVVTGCGSILRRSDAQMVPIVVLDEEVHVQAGHVEQFAHEALRQRLPVAKFVGDVDAIGREQDAAGQGEPNHFIALIASRLHLKQTEREDAEDDGDVEVEHRIENPLGLLVRGVVVLQVVRGLPCDHVEEGDDQEGIEHGGVRPETVGGEGQEDRQGHRVGKEVFEVFQNQGIEILGKHPSSAK